MNEASAIGTIRQVLETMRLTEHMEAFSATARLNEDLYLDSVRVLQLLVSLDVDHGLPIPDDAIANEHFRTIGTLAEFLVGLCGEERRVRGEATP